MVLSRLSKEIILARQKTGENFLTHVLFWSSVCTSMVTETYNIALLVYCMTITFDIRFCFNATVNSQPSLKLKGVYTQNTQKPDIFLQLGVKLFVLSFKVSLLVTIHVGGESEEIR